MQSEKIVEMAVEAGLNVDEYENHVCVSVSFSVKVVFPRATYLPEEIAEFIKKLLGF